MSEPKPARHWMVVKTVGGFGVLRPIDGSHFTKTTVVRPDKQTPDAVDGALNGVE